MERGLQDVFGVDFPYTGYHPDTVIFLDPQDNIRYTLFTLAGVAELADAHDSKSCSVRSVGSIPTFGTEIISRRFSPIIRLLMPVYLSPQHKKPFPHLGQSPGPISRQ